MKTKLEQIRVAVASSRKHGCPEAICLPDNVGTENCAVTVTTQRYI